MVLHGASHCNNCTCLIDFMNFVPSTAYRPNNNNDNNILKITVILVICVEHLRCIGGVIKGKATCENMCCSGSSFSSASGPVLNPYDTTRTAGGSSSGCAVLVCTIYCASFVR